MDEKLRIWCCAQHAEDVQVTPALPELLPRQLLVAPAQPTVERARCLPDGGKPQIAKKTPSYRARRLRCVRLVPRTLVGCPDLVDGLIFRV